MLTGAVLCQLVLVGIALCYVYISKSLVDVASGVGEGGARELVLLGCAMVLTILLRIAFQSCISYVESKAEIKIANSLRQREFDKLMHLKSDYRKHWHSGDLVNRMQSDVSAVASSIGRVIPNLTGAVLKFSAAFAYMLVLEA